MHKGCLRRIGLWTCMVVIAWGLGLAETAHAQKIGVVDLQAVLDQSVRGRSAKERLRELGDDNLRLWPRVPAQSISPFESEIRFGVSVAPLLSGA